MPEVSAVIQQLFTTGLTREAFIEKFKQIQEAAQENNEESVFTRELSDTMISAMYDSFHKGDAKQKTTTTTETTTDTDVKALASLDGDDTSVSEEDLIHLYETTLERLKNTEVSDGEVDSDSNSITVTEYLDILSLQRVIKVRLAEIEKAKVQAEIDNLVLNSNGITNELKQEYDSAKKNKQTAEENLAKKQKELEDVKNKRQSISEAVERKRGEIEGTEDKDRKNDLQNELNSLLSSAEAYENNQSDYMTEISGLNNTVRVADTRMKSITNKITTNDKGTSKKVKKLQDKIEAIEQKLKQDLELIDVQMEEVNQSYMKALHSAGYDSAVYSNMALGYSEGTIAKNAAQALANATSQIGVRESTGHNDGAQIAKYRNGVDNHAAWCASFVSWCYKGNNVFGYQASVSGIQSKAQQKGLYSEKGTYIPKVGDVMIQKSNGASHTGIVEKVDSDGTIHTIEGNASNSVKRVTYRVGSKGYNQISGWVRMSEVQV